MNKKRILSIVMATVLSASMFTGCGSKTSTSAKKDLTLTVYAGINEEPSLGLTKQFEKETGIKTNMVRMSGGELLARIKAEKSNPKASVWFGGPAESYIQAEVDGLLDKYVSPNAKDTPERYRDKEGYWTGFQTGVLGFFTNTKLLKEKGLEAPKTWDDLLKPEYKGQIVVANPASSGTAFTFIATIIQAKGDKAAMEYLKKLDGQIKQYPKTGAAPSQMVGMGECMIGIGYLHEGILQIKSGYKDLQISAPSDGTGYMVDSVALIKGGPDKEAAQKFVDWILTKNVQNTFVNYKEYQVPANKDATVPKEDDFMKDIKLINYDMQLAGTNRDKWVGEWHNVTNK